LGAFFDQRGLVLVHEGEHAENELAVRGGGVADAVGQGLHPDVAFGGGGDDVDEVAQVAAEAVSFHAASKSRSRCAHRPDTATTRPRTSVGESQEIAAVNQSAARLPHSPSGRGVGPGRCEQSGGDPVPGLYRLRWGEMAALKVDNFDLLRRR